MHRAAELDDSAARTCRSKGGTRPAAPAICRSTTRSWAAPMSSLRALAVDFHVAGLASELQETPRSSFSNPLVARSMCIRSRRWVDEPTHGACPAFRRVFWRDIQYFFDGDVHRKFYACLRESVAPDNHPCKQLPHPRLCREAFVHAMEPARTFPARMGES